MARARTVTRTPVDEVIGMPPPTEPTHPTRPRATKIVATLGPASAGPEVLERMVRAGVDVARLNFSHGKTEDHAAWVADLREACARTGRTVGLLVDLQGPKIRIGTFRAGRVTLVAGASFVLDTRDDPGDQERVGLDYPDLIREVAVGDVVVLDDGRIVFDVEDVSRDAIRCRVRRGGVLSDRKGINLQGGGLGAPALTDKDVADIQTAARLHADYVAVSFVKSGDDMRQVRDLLRKASSHALLIAKIERNEAVQPEALDDILAASDGIMVARGDLAIEVGDAQVPALQKHLIRIARARNKLVITATQMMESMVASPVPTRAEVSDVANAVLDGTDAVMLSAESAVGQYPVETVQAMSRVCLEAERSSRLHLDRALLDRVFTRVDQSIAMAALFTSSHLNLKAIATLTESGSTPLYISRLNCGVPIYALTTQTSTRYRVSLLRDVYPLTTQYQGHDRDALFEEAEAVMLRSGAAQIGDLVALGFGEPIGEPGGTNALKIIRIGESRRP